MIKIKLIYRNYKPLHKVYESIVSEPPEGVSYIVPVTNNKIRFLHKIYKRVRFFKLIKPLVGFSEKILFLRGKSNSDDADIYQYLNIIADTIPAKPYIVDTEHAAGLVSFTTDYDRIKRVRSFLSDPMCKGISCWSLAAQRTLKQLMDGEYNIIAKKVHVIYPSLARIDNLRPSHEIISKRKNCLRLLIVGNQSYLKGLEELLAAIKSLNGEYGAQKLELYVVSDDAKKIVESFNLPNVKLFPPDFTKKEILEKFYMRADLFIMPTKQETFGMAILDALICGTPVVTTNQFACREMVEDDKDGILLKLDNSVMDTAFIPDKKAMDSVTKSNFNTQLCDEIISVIGDILDGKKDLKKMGVYGKKKFEKGQQFSIELRNQKLMTMYENALSD